MGGLREGHESIRGQIGGSMVRVTLNPDKPLFGPLLLWRYDLPFLDGAVYLLPEVPQVLTCGKVSRAGAVSVQ